MATTELRKQISEQLETIKKAISEAQPPVVQELVLAQRHLEDARMRLGVAECYSKGINPWVNEVKE